MNPTPNATNPTASSKIGKKRSLLQVILVFIRELIAISVWGYIIIKLFVFDIDIFLIEKLSPNLLWLVHYKFFVIIGVLAIILLLTKNLQIMLWSLFIFFYPVIVIFWKLPVLLYKSKSWNLTFALIDSIISFFKTFRYTFITTSFFLISMVIIIVASDRYILWASLIGLLMVHFWVYIQKMISVFKPSNIYQVYSKIFSGLAEFARLKPTSSSLPTLALSEQELEIPVESMNETQIQKWSTGVQYLAMFNRICLFGAKKVKAYQESRFNIISSVFGILLLVCFTVFSFTFLNFGLFKINPDYFSFPVQPTFFNFFYYSFNTFLFNQVQEIVAKAPIAQIASMTESFFALFLIAILVSLILSFRVQRESDELNELITFLKKEGEKAEEYLKDKYKLGTVEEAMEALRKLNSIFADFLYNLTNTINN